MHLYVRGRPPKKDTWKKKNEGSKGSKSKSKGKSIVCYECQEEGHYKRQCPKLRQGENKNKDSTSEGKNANIVYNEDNSYVLTIAPDSCDSGWILDTGCSFHMTPNRDWIQDYEEFDGGSVLMGNHAACKVVGIGSVRIKMKDGSVLDLKGVRHIPELKKNPISLGNQGYGVSIRQGVLKITKGNLIVFKGKKKEAGLYRLDGAQEICLAISSIKDSTRLWHLRLRHMSQRGLEELWRQGALGDQIFSELEFCKHCVMGKSTRVNFDTS